MNEVVSKVSWRKKYLSWIFKNGNNLINERGIVIKEVPVLDF